VRQFFQVTVQSKVYKKYISWCHQMSNLMFYSDVSLSNLLSEFFIDNAYSSFVFISTISWLALLCFYMPICTSFDVVTRLLICTYMNTVLSFWLDCLVIFLDLILIFCLFLFTCWKESLGSGPSPFQKFVDDGLHDVDGWEHSALV